MKIRSVLLLFLVFMFSCQRSPEKWAFEYPGDDFSKDAMLDLSYLNEEVAGEHGFIALSDDGEAFVRGDGQDIRFWAVNTMGGEAKSMDELRQHAKFLAKMGVNMARYHGSVNPPGDSEITDIDSLEVDAIWKYQAAMKEEGIYTTISPFWAHYGHMGMPNLEKWGLEGFSGDDGLWGAMYFYDELKEAYKTWVRYLYTEVNPYTGIALKDDPSLAIIQIKNEDGIFFWTMQYINPVFKEIIKERFTRWLINKYGSYDNTLEAWNNCGIEGDVRDEVFEIFQTWETTQDLSQDKQLRMTDQIRFFYEVQYNFYKEIHDFYRDELGCQQLINANNWKTADAVRLNDLERLSYTACEVSAVNRYFAPGHTGDNSGWRIDSGHFFMGNSALKDPVKIPVNIKQTKGQPMLVTESGWNFPNRFQTEAPLLVSSYMSLTGVDSYYWFNINAIDLDNDPYFNFEGMPENGRPMNRWTYSTPWGVFMFPANALMFRQKYIQEGRVVVEEKRSKEEIFRREIPAISEENSYDPNRDSEFSYKSRSNKDKINPLAFLAGPVKSDLQAKTSALNVESDLSLLISEDQPVVKSVTGEMELNYSDGIFKLDTPKAKGLTGFLSENVSFVFDGMIVKSIDEYASLNVVSMDGKDLKNSEKILIQTGTRFTPSGWKTEATENKSNGEILKGFKVISTGQMPWMGNSLGMNIELKNTGVQHAWLLNSAGYAEKEIKMERNSDVLSIELPYNATYIVLRK